MTGNMKTFTVSIGRDVPQATALGFPCAYLVYTADSGSLKITSPPGPKGGLMGLYGTGVPLGGVDAERVAGEIAAQIKRRGFGGLLLDMPVTDDGAAFVSRLCPFIASMGIVHYVPVEFASRAPQAKLILPSAISGGSFSEMLERYCSNFPPSRLCLELIKTQNDFTMPSQDPSGRPLSKQEFDYLLSRSGGGYYSSDLYCRYFTYTGNDGAPHFVMFDDRVSAREKALLASRMGFFSCFALYGEWREDIKYIYG
ncbi:MAG: hypothetical protein VB078_04390 [Clostridiaceae bacterium]|nr:hypothetical protein [Clostridiaceae bacterium]